MSEQATYTEHIYQEYHYKDFEPIHQREEIVRCRDCKFGVDGGKYCAEGCADSWDWRCVEPDGFCAWGERRKNDN